MMSCFESRILERTIVFLVIWEQPKFMFSDYIWHDFSFLWSMKFYETHFCYVNLVIFLLFAIKFLEDGYGFSSSQIWMWKLDHKESWVPRNWCFWTVVLGKSLESPLDCKEINPRKSILNIHLKDWCWSWSSNALATWCEELTQ